MKNFKKAMAVVSLVALTALVGPGTLTVFAGTPAKGGAHASSARAARGKVKAQPAGKISINKATADQLATLPRIGPKTAQRIVDYRTKHKGFKKLDELQNVKGIGAKTMERLRSHITL